MTQPPRPPDDGPTTATGPASPDAAPAVVPATPVPQRRPRFLTWPVLAWGLWDWGSASFNAVITTFVFTVYLVDKSFGNPTDNEFKLSVGLAVAGVLIALLAPVNGQRADRAGRAVFWLGVHTAVVVAISAALFFVWPDPEHRSTYLWLGIVLLGVGNIFFEMAGVNYNGILPQIATKDRIGAVSGFGWGMGYIGGIVLLLIVYFGFISPEVGWFGVTGTDGLDVRVSMLVAAAWFGLSAIPVMVTLSGRRGRRRRQEMDDASRRGEDRGLAGLENEPTEPERISRGPRRRESLRVSYRRLWRTLVMLHRTHPEVLWFLVAAAIFRDGLAGVFAYGGIIAKNTFGFSDDQVITFAVAANIVAGVATIGLGRLDDLLGPRRVILGSLTILVLAGLGVFVLHNHGAGVFWILGLTLSACVGPAQSAARSFLARVIPEGREGEIFGLYATTGRAVSFLAPGLYAVFLWAGQKATHADSEGATHWGILGIVVVLVAGLLLMLRVKDPRGRITDLED